METFRELVEEKTLTYQGGVAQWLRREVANLWLERVT